MATATEVKIISDTGTGSFRIGGYGVVFGGQDIVGDFFSKNTDFWFDRLAENPVVLFQHGQDALLKRTVVGRIVTKVPDDIGLWVEAQITAAKQYADAIRELVSKGVLGWSSGSVPHLVQRVKGTLPNTNEITSWPIVELSLTPTPAEPRTVGVRELKSLAQIDPLLIDVAAEAEAKELPQETKPWKVTLRDGKYCVIGGASGSRNFGCHDTREGAMAQMRALYANESKATLSADARNNLSASSFAYIDSDGGRHLPINDEAHVRAAMARFNQTSFESPEKKKAAARKILARARSMGIDVAPDSAIANAAKGVTMQDESEDDLEELTGSAAKLADLGRLLLEIAETAQDDLGAMARFKMDTRDGHRFYEGTLARVEEVYDELAHVIAWAKSIDQGEDGLRRVNYYKHRLALIALEASA